MTYFDIDQLSRGASAIGRVVQEHKDEVARLQSNLDAALARVAELEAALGEKSAQGWRNFTEHPPIGEQIQITTVIDAVREEPDGLYRIGHTSEWQAWRPAPQEQS